MNSDPPQPLPALTPSTVSLTHGLARNTFFNWNVYGLEDASERGHVVTDLVRSGQNGRIRCLTSGTERRQFLYVEGLRCRVTASARNAATYR